MTASVSPRYQGCVPVRAPPYLELDVRVRVVQEEQHSKRAIPQQENEDGVADQSRFCEPPPVPQVPKMAVMLHTNSDALMVHTVSLDIPAYIFAVCQHFLSKAAGQDGLDAQLVTRPASQHT